MLIVVHILLGSCGSKQRIGHDLEASSLLSIKDIHLSLFSPGKLVSPTFAFCTSSHSLDFEVVAVSSLSYLGVPFYKRLFSCPGHVEMWRLTTDTFLFRSAENFIFHSCPRNIFYKWKTALTPWTVVMKSYSTFFTRFFISTTCVLIIVP